MKRTWLLVALFLLLGAGAFYALRMKKTQTGSHVSWDMDFAVKNPQDITKIFIADRRGQTATLERQGDTWIYNGRYKARPTAVQTLLETVSKLNVLFIPTKSSEESTIRGLAAEGIKVEIYGKNGEKLKSYYVGGMTNDERGTYMIMDGAEQPYAVHVPSFIGQVRVRYMVGDDNWRDRTVFEEKPEDIQSVSIEYPQQKSESFRIEKTEGKGYDVKPLFSTTPPSKSPLRKGIVEAYLLQYEKLGAEGFETDYPLRDSVTALVPFAIVSVKKTGGQEKQVRFWPVSVQYRTVGGEPFVVRYFTDVNNGESFMMTQDHVFGPIFRGYHFFFSEPEKPRLRN
ncbi:MAG: DUF4340 domain-containing protein [Thermoanaerobaculia bacterium]|nr:DUF4340 domain-containing protein [Thermoanaerobaculia bacterium]